jgi:hypothetical protein
MVLIVSIENNTCSIAYSSARGLARAEPRAIPVATTFNVNYILVKYKVSSKRCYGKG